MPHREFQDSKGKRWDVWDVYPTRSITGRAPDLLLGEDAAEGWLAFQCGREKRRFYRHPPGWESLSDQELALLCHHATALPQP